ncbi:hypothetical protein AB0C34_17735 [Nocardia sp. NPDC049220]|uniref:hypothetical protein n=1 Tax=Nocardia sp. NPDC049220 TaxID=3155273 RepID=UPI0033CC5052
MFVQLHCAVGLLNSERVVWCTVRRIEQPKYRSSSIIFVPAPPLVQVGGGLTIWMTASTSPHDTSGHTRDRHNDQEYVQLNNFLIPSVLVESGR